MTNITKAAQDALESLYVAYDQTCSVGRPKDWKQIKDAIDALRAALQDKAGEVPADFLPRLMAAVRIYQQQDYQAEEEASIADVAELYRAVCRIVGPSQPAPVVPDGCACAGGAERRDGG